VKKASRYRLALPFVALAVAAIAFALLAGRSSATGRELDASFCQTSTFCIDLKYGDLERNVPNPEPISLRPGTYTLSLVDNSGRHNFALRSCEGSDTTCGPPPPGTPDDATALTPICNNDTSPCSSTNTLDESVKLLLKHGTYRLFCQAMNHEANGMYVDIVVGGVGQVG
jgi:hypothetical protein